MGYNKIYGEEKLSFARKHLTKFVFQTKFYLLYGKEAYGADLSFNVWLEPDIQKGIQQLYAWHFNYRINDWLFKVKVETSILGNQLFQDIE